MTSFKTILKRAEKRKGGSKNLQSLLSDPKSSAQLKKQSNAFYLSRMMQCVFNAGFQWRVVTKKWPNFEKVFFNFEPSKVLLLSEAQWENIYKNPELIRNRTKLTCTIDNALFVEDIIKEHESFGKFLAAWPSSEQVDLLALLKKRGARLGGNTGQYFLRYSGKDGFILSRDVITCLQGAGLDIKSQPTSKRDLNKIQEAFNFWHEETELPYTHLSQIAAYSVGENYL